MTYEICSRCVMDTSDQAIYFDTNGVCNHCHGYDLAMRNFDFGAPNIDLTQGWSSLIDKMKQAGVGKDYDCLLGLSGGLDSSYLALKVHDAGLRVLAVHVDAGWNSEVAVANIESVVRYCGFDLHTEVVSWPEMRDLHVSYLKSGLANQDVPQDHIFVSSLFNFAKKNEIKYILSGGNHATEGVFPKSWQSSAMDAINLKSVHKNHGDYPLKNYKTISFFEYYYFWYPFVKQIRVLRPLNFMYYEKAHALKTLVNRAGYKPYEQKHGESLFTRLFQGYILPTRFGFDKRRPHLSSLILSNQMSRFNALAELKKSPYDDDELELDISYFCKKLNITRSEFESFMQLPQSFSTSYKNWDTRYKFFKKIQKFSEKITGRNFKWYS